MAFFMDFLMALLLIWSSAAPHRLARPAGIKYGVEQSHLLQAAGRSNQLGMR